MRPPSSESGSVRRHGVHRRSNDRLDGRNRDGSAVHLPREEVRRHDPRQGVPAARGYPHPSSKEDPPHPEGGGGFPRIHDPRRPRGFVFSSSGPIPVPPGPARGADRRATEWDGDRTSPRRPDPAGPLAQAPTPAPPDLPGPQSLDRPALPPRTATL